MVWFSKSFFYPILLFFNRLHTRFLTFPGFPTFPSENWATRSSRHKAHCHTASSDKIFTRLYKPKHDIIQIQPYGINYPQQQLTKPLSPFQQRRERCMPKSISENLKKAKPNPTTNALMIPAMDPNNANFATPIKIAKTEAAKKIAKILRRCGADYDSSKWIVKEARRLAELTPEAKPKKQPALLTHSELGAFFHAVDSADDIQHQLMFRLLFYSGIRVSELVKIKKVDIDMSNTTIRIVQAKGSKDRVAPFPKALQIGLSAYHACSLKQLTS